MIHEANYFYCYKFQAIEIQVHCRNHEICYMFNQKREICKVFRFFYKYPGWSRTEICCAVKSENYLLSPMNTNRLSGAIATALNAQLTNEAHASEIYLSYGAWLEQQGYSGMANFLFRHAQEERNHMMKILEYILKRGAGAKISAIPAPPSNPASVPDCFEKIFAHEVENTKSIYRIVKLSMEENDWATWNFMQWFVKEQVEEETLAMELLGKVKIVGGGKASGDALFILDRDLQNAPDEARSAQDVTAENP
jgi:ferritin